jgi:hypothetical protein
MTEEDRAGFPEDIWILSHQQLTVATAVVTELAKAYRARPFGDQGYHGGGKWPACGLRKRISISKVAELKLKFNGQYFTGDERILYNLYEQIKSDWFGPVSFRKIRDYSSTEVQNAELIRQDFERILSQYQSPWTRLLNMTIRK